MRLQRIRIQFIEWCSRGKFNQVSSPKRNKKKYFFFNSLSTYVSCVTVCKWWCLFFRVHSIVFDECEFRLSARFGHFGTYESDVCVCVEKWKRNDRMKDSKYLWRGRKSIAAKFCFSPFPSLFLPFVHSIIFFVSQLSRFIINCHVPSLLICSAIKISVLRLAAAHTDEFFIKFYFSDTDNDDDDGECVQCSILLHFNSINTITCVRFSQWEVANEKCVKNTHDKYIYVFCAVCCRELHSDSANIKIKIRAGTYRERTRYDSLSIEYIRVWTWNE